jgi:two-component system phosphate regulon sensor histidine kinase PhoR
MTRFRTKLMMVLVFSMLAILLGLGILLGQLFHAQYLKNFNERLLNETILIAQSVPVGHISKDAHTNLNKMSEALDVRISILTKDGVIVEDLGKNIYSLNKDTTILLKDLAKKSNGESPILVTEKDDGMLYYSTLLVSSPEQPERHLVVSTRSKQWFVIQNQIWVLLFVTLGLSLLVILWLASRMTNRYTRPIESATKVAIDLAGGDYHARTYETAQEETSKLNTSINILARNLQEMMKVNEIQQERLMTLIENMGSGLVLIDQKGRVIIVNRTFRERFKIPELEKEKMIYYEIIPFKEIQSVVEEIFVTEKKIKKQITLSFKREKKHFELYGTPIFGNQNEWNGVVLVFHDITELKKLEQARKDFVANVSHELRTPITSIKGFSETLLDGAMSDQDTLKTFLEIILKESDRVQSLVKDLLDLSKIEQTGFQLYEREFNAKDLLNEVKTILDSRAKSKSIDLVVEAPERFPLYGDPDRLMQVLINLVNNSISYTLEGGRVLLSVEKRKRTAEIRVEDNGIGIKAKELPRIFERFYRVDKDRSRNSGGTGLGLAIVKHIVEAHKGYVNIESVVGKGTTVIVSLSLEKAPIH